jgi:glycosyltransferase involved in cell wall biosynthesis
MLIWILQTGEPLHIDEGSHRPMRAMNLSDKLVGAGHTVILWSSAFSHQGKNHRTKAYKTHKVNSRLEIRLIPSYGYRKHIGVGRLLDHAKMAWNLRKLLNKEKVAPDIAFIGYPPIETAAIMSGWLKKREVPMILDVKDLWPSMFVEVFPKIIQPIAKVIFYPYFYLARRTVNDATALSAMAPSFLKWVLNFSNKEKSILDRIFPLTSQSGQVNNIELIEATKWWGEQGVEGKTLPVVFFVGSFMSVFDFVPVAVAAKKLQNVHFVLCGEGDYLDQVKSSMKHLDNVIFPGWVDRPKIESLAKISIASLAPYKNIDNYIVNTPNKIVDALLLGLPILSPLRGEVGDLIESNKIGYTYSDNVPLSDCIQSLLNNDKLQKKMSENAKKLYDEEFEFDKVYDSLVDHLEGMVIKK